MPTWGRGGAGNIVSEEQLSGANKQVAADLEANRSAASGNAALDQATQPTESANQEYAHMGRGGAGNFFSPSALTSTGTFSSATRSHLFGDATLPPAASVDVSEGHRGRGGAGNYIWGGQSSTEEQERERRAREEEEQQVSEKVERDVEAGLARPGRVVLSGGRERVEG